MFPSIVLSLLLAQATPKGALEEIVDLIHAHKLVAIYDLLSEAGRKKVDTRLQKLVPSLDLGPEATGREIVKKEMEKLKAGNSPLLKLLDDASLEILAVEREGETAANLTVRAEVLGKTLTGTVRMVLEGGSWKVDDARPSTGDTKPPPSPRVLANERAARATLLFLVAAEAQFRATGRADGDQDGTGEYGTFGELSGATGVRNGKPFDPPALGPAFRHLKKGRITRGGYYFRIFLPDAKGAGVKENDTGGAAKTVDPPKAETYWCCYAWPVQQGVTGKRTFFINQEGALLATGAKDYGGDQEPAATAAFLPPSGRGKEPAGPAAGITGKPAANAKGGDGHLWKKLS